MNNPKNVWVLITYGVPYEEICAHEYTAWDHKPTDAEQVATLECEYAARMKEKWEGEPDDDQKPTFEEWLENEGELNLWEIPLNVHKAE